MQKIQDEQIYQNFKYRQDLTLAKAYWSLKQKEKRGPLYTWFYVFCFGRWFLPY